MASDSGKLAANRRNAQKSTGPRSSAGKRSSSRNALSHGLRSEELLLDGENAAEFAGLLESLVQDLSPSGTYEHYLIERIAVGMWRSRRLIRAERAEIELSQHHTAVKKRLLVDYGYLARMQASELAGVAESQQGVRAQLAAIGEDIDRLAAQETWPEFDELAAKYPHLCQWIETEAADAKMSVLLYCGFDSGGVLKHLPRIVKAIRASIKKILEGLEGKEEEKHAVDLATVGQLVPLRADVLARYQTTLDHQVERAFRQLMQAKALRGITIDANTR